MATRYTASHWGLYEVGRKADGFPKLMPFSGDPDPSPIGLDQLESDVARLRVARPAVRQSWLEHGPGSHPEQRGREPFVEVSWEDALALVAAELTRVRATYGNEAIFGGSYGWSSAGRFHHAQSQVHRFLNMVGGYVRHVDTYSLAAGRVIMPHVVGPIDDLHAEHTSWDVLAEHTRLLVSFGGVPLKNSRVSPGGAGRHRVKEALAQMAASGTRFINISPLRENLVTDGDVEWIPIRPNTDTSVMLALAHELFKTGHADDAFLERCCVGGEAFRDYVLGLSDGQPKTPAWAAEISGVPAARIIDLAQEMAGTRTLLNVAWSLQRAEHGEQPFWAIVALACVLGQVGLPGGGFGLGYGAMNAIGSPHPRLKGPSLPQGRNPVTTFIPVARIADMLLNPGGRFTYEGKTHRYPDIRLIYWAGGNPYHHHQDLARLRRAWAKPDTIIVHEQFWNAHARMADIVLPATLAAERNDIAFATREGMLVAMHQAAPAHAEARDDFAIFSDLADRLGVGAAFTEGLDERAWLARLYATFVASAAANGIAVPDFPEFWERGVVDLAPHDEPVVFLDQFRSDPVAHPRPTPSGRIELFSTTVADAQAADCPGHPAWLPPTEWLGAPTAERWPIHLVSDQPARRLHSQLDHAPWSLAGKSGGREVVLVNTADAAARGIADGDVVDIVNGRGTVQAVAAVSDDIVAGAARLATGAWIDPAEDADAHGNPNVLTADRPASSFSQGCAALSCLVEIRRCAAPLPPTAHKLPPLIHRNSIRNAS
ncbi:molybdopterin-dependent oxidoreductase [Chelatococcus asaccharovorans]|uniref:Biotin/methionine sulfoxide reductase n=1 Tax=Chelatococcus asaccharovorans TaxID=28210 RepID=A0A2V3TWW9_9HYPH|nr:molybdopterin-dependent oxidoreductase [Chelatococcus asaccharovorans]MBS7707531.1 molybdopterin-dependent oxidoreductase [Chelatococcus asaccharovorans]PXW54148.1 biotin/methionine sulfoxide reductase [Chelatococcus asaccharovorans]